MWQPVSRIQIPCYPSYVANHHTTKRMLQSGNKVSEHIAKVGSSLASVRFVLCYVNMSALAAKVWKGSGWV